MGNHCNRIFQTGRTHYYVYIYYYNYIIHSKNYFHLASVSLNFLKLSLQVFTALQLLKFICQVHREVLDFNSAYTLQQHFLHIISIPSNKSSILKHSLRKATDYLYLYLKLISLLAELSCAHIHPMFVQSVLECICDYKTVICIRNKPYLYVFVHNQKSVEIN